MELYSKQTLQKEVQTECPAGTVLSGRFKYQCNTEVTRGRLKPSFFFSKIRKKYNRGVCVKIVICVIINQKRLIRLLNINKAREVL